MPIRAKDGKHRLHCDRCDLGTQRASGADREEAEELAIAEGFQAWQSTQKAKSPWKYLCPWCVWEVGLPDEAHEIIKRMLETLARKGEAVGVAP